MTEVVAAARTVIANPAAETAVREVEVIEAAGMIAVVTIEEAAIAIVPSNGAETGIGAGVTMVGTGRRVPISMTARPPESHCRSNRRRKRFPP